MGEGSKQEIEFIEPSPEQIAGDLASSELMQRLSGVESWKEKSVWDNLKIAKLQALLDKLKNGEFFEDAEFLDEDNKGQEIKLSPYAYFKDEADFWRKTMEEEKDYPSSVEFDTRMYERIQRVVEAIERLREQPEREIKETKRARETKGFNAPESEKEEIKKAWEVLADKKVMQVMEEKPEVVTGAFETVTGRDLIKDREEMVAENLKPKHMKVIRGEDVIEKYRKWIIRKEQEKILQENHSNALRTLWERNPDIKEEDREKYLANLKKELGLDKKGGDVALDRLINDGYEVERAKKPLHFVNLNKILIHKIGTQEDLIFDSKKENFESLLEDIKKEITDMAEATAKLKIMEGRNTLQDERYSCTEKIIIQAVENYKSGKKPVVIPPKKETQAKQGETKSENKKENLDEIGVKQEEAEELTKPDITPKSVVGLEKRIAEETPEEAKLDDMVKDLLNKEPVDDVDRLIIKELTKTVQSNWPDQLKQENIKTLMKHYQSLKQRAEEANKEMEEKHQRRTEEIEKDKEEIRRIDREYEENERRIEEETRKGLEEIDSRYNRDVAAVAKRHKERKWYQFWR